MSEAGLIYTFWELCSGTDFQVKVTASLIMLPSPSLFMWHIPLSPLFCWLPGPSSPHHSMLCLPSLSSSSSFDHQSSLPCHSQFRAPQRSYGPLGQLMENLMSLKELSCSCEQIHLWTLNNCVKMLLKKKSIFHSGAWVSWDAQKELQGSRWQGRADMWEILPCWVPFTSQSCALWLAGVWERLLMNYTKCQQSVWGPVTGKKR